MKSSTIDFLKKSGKKNIIFIFFCSLLVSLGPLMVSGQSLSCFSVLSGTITVYTNSGECYNSVTNNYYDVTSGTNLTCLVEKSKWTFTYELEGATTGSGSTTLNNIHFNKGLTGVTWTGVYTSTGYTYQFQKYYLQVKDKEVPVITCSQDITLNNDPGQGGAVITFPAASATDNCELDTLYISSGMESGSLYPIGTTTVQNKAIDVDGNMSVKSFNVTVNDVEFPVFNVPEKKVTYANATNGSYVFYDLSYTDNDNDSVSVELLSGVPSGGFFDPGLTNCVYEITDKSGNTTIDTIEIEVIDSIPPQLVCPSSVVQVFNIENTCEAKISYIITANDNCPDFLQLYNTEGPLPDSIVPVGSSFTVTWIAKDVYNTETCSFNVVALDNEAPVLTIPSDTSVDGTLPFYFVITASDNCQGVSWEQTAGLPSGSVFPVGTTVNTFVATDAYGNTSTQSFNVIVVPFRIACCDGFSVEITEKRDPSYCNSASDSLFATITDGLCDNSAPYTYIWSTGATTQNIHVTEAGTYYVTASNVLGCQAIDSMVVNVISQPASALANYVIVARTHAKFDNSIVHSGGIGITNALNANGNVVLGGKLFVTDNSVITGTGTFVQGSDITIDNSSQVSTVINSPADIKLPVFESMPYTGTIDVKIPNNSTVYLTDTLYREINVGKGATAVFTQPVVNIDRHLKLQHGSTVKFTQCAKVRCNQTVDAGQHVTINPGEKSVTFYCGDNVNFHQGAHVTGFFI